LTRINTEDTVAVDRSPLKTDEGKVDRDVKLASAQGAATATGGARSCVDRVGVGTEHIGLEPLDTVTATGGGGNISDLNISAQSGTSGQNPSGTVSFTFEPSASSSTSADR
jgi:hypothetical protein